MSGICDGCSFPINYPPLVLSREVVGFAPEVAGFHEIACLERWVKAQVGGFTDLETTRELEDLRDQIEVLKDLALVYERARSCPIGHPHCEFDA